MAHADNHTHLIEKARNGDKSALEELLRAVQPHIYRFSMKMCRHTEDAEDVLQDSMMALARSFRDFRGESSLSTWLFTIARSFCIKKRRKSKFAPAREESLDTLTHSEQTQVKSSIPDPHDQAESVEFWKQIEAGIRRIKPAYREILLLRDIEGLPAKEVAKIAGISVPAVKSRLHRARAELRDHLATTPYRPLSECPDIRKAFSQHLEGDLSAALCSTMEAHIASCPACAAECDGLKQVLNACSASTCEISETVQERLQEAMRAALHSTAI